MTFEEAVAYIDETPKFTTKNSLEHTRECLRRLGNPQEQFKVIHIAGTNGKGSTCAFLTSIMREAGYSCGLFTSPHLVEINERFQINEVNIDDETFLNAFHKVKALADELVSEGSYHPTYFEMLFLMGMVIFAEAKVEYVVLETGLGGRLDATTSIADPIACVITSISLDHMQYLGNTIPEIAGEKAGIIVPGVPVIYDGNDEAAAEVIAAYAQKTGSPSYKVCTADTEVLENTANGIAFRYLQYDGENPVFHIPFIAKYQVMNASLAIKTMEILQNRLSVTDEAIHKGIAETRWQGRMEQVLPGVIVDGAHNADGVMKFVDTAEYFQQEYPLTLLFSAVDDKDYTDMIHTICSRIHFEHVIVTQVGGYRKVDFEKLKEIFVSNGIPAVEGYDTTQEAFTRALALKQDYGMLFCVGSLYLVGEIKALIRRMQK
ncbi:MAG: folylpolyglutamate synthase/dihydrofolate synthase family protein [Eubacteriales bacterium]|nr:folylpolyglutamate synthase/dihydrofolate synthase family protein [Eubacteriales bacterium]